MKNFGYMLVFFCVVSKHLLMFCGGATNRVIYYVNDGCA